MGGFLGALGAIKKAGIDIGRTWQNYNTVKQQQANRAAFGSAIDALPPDPEYDLMRQMHKAGASPEAVLQIAHSTIGEQLQKDWDARRWQDFVGPGGIKELTPDKIWEVVGRRIFTPDKAMKYQDELLKYKIEEQKLAASGQPKLSANFATFLATRNLTQEDLKNMSDPDRAKLTKDFEQMFNIGPGATTLKTVHRYDTGEDEITAVQAHPELGTVVGVAKPPVGGNPMHLLNAVNTGMQQTLELLKPMGDSKLPLQLPQVLISHGVAPSKQYVELSDQVGAVYTTLTTMIMRAGGFRNVAAATEFMNTHVPRPGVDSPELIRDKLEQWMKPGPGGLMNQYREMLGANMYAVPNAAGGLDAVPMPPPAAGEGVPAEPPDDLSDL